GHGRATVGRALSSLGEGDLEDILVGEGEGRGEGSSVRNQNNTFSEVPEEGSWVFHPVEKLPSRWREGTWRRGKAPWVWQRALDLFSEPAPPSESLFHELESTLPSAVMAEAPRFLGRDRGGVPGNELTRAFSAGYRAGALGYHHLLDHG
ncbi:unnamed protein product, partial [Choristocarpus tenellus]